MATNTAEAGGPVIKLTVVFVTVVRSLIVIIAASRVVDDCRIRVVTPEALVESLPLNEPKVVENLGVSPGTGLPYRSVNRAVICEVDTPSATIWVGFALSVACTASSGRNITEPPLTVRLPL